MLFYILFDCQGDADSNLPSDKTLSEQSSLATANSNSSSLTSVVSLTGFHESCVIVFAGHRLLSISAMLI